MIRCTIKFTVHHCTQNCNRPAKYGYILPKSDAIYPACEKHKKDDLMEELGGKRYPIKKAIAIVESR